MFSGGCERFMKLLRPFLTFSDVLDVSEVFALVLSSTKVSKGYEKFSNNQGCLKKFRIILEGSE